MQLLPLFPSFGEIGVAIRTIPKLSREMRSAAETLAVNINKGEYAELLPHQRTELRALSLAIAEWADRAADLERPSQPAPRERSLGSRVGRLVIKLRGR